MEMRSGGVDSKRSCGEKTERKMRESVTQRGTGSNIRLGHIKKSELNW